MGTFRQVFKKEKKLNYYAFVVLYFSQFRVVVLLFFKHTAIMKSENDLKWESTSGLKETRKEEDLK